MSYTEKKLSTMPYAQARVTVTAVNDTVCIRLISYATTVAEIQIVNGTKYCKVYGLYSATTRRHLSAFFREYTEPMYPFKGFEFVKYVLDYTNHGLWCDEWGCGYEKI